MILIIGEAGDRPWIEGSASERLWRWFGCSSYEELTKVARLENVYKRYGQKRAEDVTDLGHIQDLEALCDSGEFELVFLVGRVAQRKMCPIAHHLALVYKVHTWVHSRYVLIPHPSGLNRVLNDGGDERTREFVQAQMRRLA